MLSVVSINIVENGVEMENDKVRNFVPFTNTNKQTSDTSTKEYSVQIALAAIVEPSSPAPFTMDYLSRQV
jgi:hypothetical protein